jgi:hypothetical protein
MKEYSSTISITMPSVYILDINRADYTWLIGMKLGMKSMPLEAHPSCFNSVSSTMPTLVLVKPVILGHHQCSLTSSIVWVDLWQIYIECWIDILGHDNRKCCGSCIVIWHEICKFWMKCLSVALHFGDCISTKPQRSCQLYVWEYCHPLLYYKLYVLGKKYF